MSAVEAHRQHVEALSANGGLMAELIVTMDRALESPAYVFEGRIGEWRQAGGPPNPAVLEATEHDARFTIHDIQELHRVHTLTVSGASTKIEAYDSASVALRATGGEAVDMFYVRRLVMRGVRSALGVSTADEYRFEWSRPAEGLKNYLIFVRLGTTAVHGEFWVLPDESEFFRRCVDAFANREVVDEVLRGAFTDEADLDRMLRLLIVPPHESELYHELRAKALATHAANEMIDNANLNAPDQDQLTTALTVLRQAF